jgi:hypothetical protein
MNYREIRDIDGNNHIIIDNGDESFKSFSADNSNPEFIAFLRELEKENDPYFTEWVEAGNNPDEFWTQSNL